MSTNADDLIAGWEASPPSPGTSAPAPAVDPLQNDINIYTHAYGLAAKAGDTSAMSELHGHLLNAYQKQTARDSNPTAGNSGAQNFVEGTGRGMAKVADTVSGPKTQLTADEQGNLVGSLSPDQSKLTDDKLDAPLLATRGGSLGNLAGEVAATAPIGGAGGAAGEALGMGKLAGAGLGRLAGRVGARAAQAGAEGGAASAATGEDAGQGAAVNAALSLPLSAAGRVVRGIVGKSEAANNLVQAAGEENKDLHIPISQGGTGPMKTLYKTVLPYFFGAREQLEHQAGKAEDTLGDTLMTHAPAPQLDAAGNPVKTPLPAPGVEGTPQEMAANVRKQSDAAYQNTIKKYAFQPPEDFHANVLDNLTGSELPTGHKQQIANTLDSILQSHLSEDGTLSGANLLRAKEAGREALGNLRSPGGLAALGNPASTEQALGSFDGMVDDAIKTGRTAAPAGTIRSKNMLADFNKANPDEAGVGQLGQRMNGNSTAELYADPGDPNTVHLEKLQADTVKQGAGSAALKQITDLADRHGTNVTLSAVPQKVAGQPTMSQADLIKYYQKAGFKLDGNGAATMTRTPEPNAQVQTDLKNFKQLQSNYGESNAILSTVEGNVPNKGSLRGQWGKLAKAAPDGSQMQGLAQDAHEVFGESAGGVDPAGRHLMNVAKESVGPGAAFVAGGPGAALGALGAANILARPGTQRFLYGDTDMQRAIASALHKNPNAAHLADFATRQGIADNAP
jgi:hypothetical protein